MLLNLEGYVSALEFIDSITSNCFNTESIPKVNDELNQCGKNRYLNVYELVLKR